MKRKKQSGFKGLPGWYASYADMFTLLMVFFLMLFAASILDEDMFVEFLVGWDPSRADVLMVGGAGGDLPVDFGAGIHPDYEPPTPPGEGGVYDGGGDDDDGDTVGDMYNTFMTYWAAIPGIGDEWGGQPPEVTLEDDFIRITLDAQEGVHFASAQATLLPGAREILDLLGPILYEFTIQGHGIIVEGHTDNRPINTPMFSSNWPLSAHRATAVVEYLVQNFNIDPRMMNPVGRGEYFPIVYPAVTEADHAMNRRVEILVLSVEATAGGGAIGGGWWRWQIPGT